MKTYLLMLLVLLLFSACGGSGGSETKSTTTSPTDTQEGSNTNVIDDNASKSSIARTLSVAPYTSVDGVTIATSYLKFKDTAPKFEALVPYLGGSIDGKYITDVLDGSAIAFDVKVPNDTATYGKYANTSVKYIGILYYPSILDSNYTNPQTLSSWDVPSSYTQMEKKIDSSPIFADKTKKYPLVVYSHGKGGNIITEGRNLYRFATHGYAVLSLNHGDRRFKEYSPLASDSPQETTLRPLAIKKAIDMLQNSKYKTNIDFDKIGAYGTSYGGATSFMLVGAKPIDLISYIGVLKNTANDSRIKAAVGIVPYMGDDTSAKEVFGTLVTFFGFDISGATTVTKPYLAITGTDDVIAKDKYTQAALAKIPSSGHLVSLEGEKHDLTTQGSNTAETWAYYFLNYHLKGDSTFLSMKNVTGNPINTYSAP